MMDIENCWSQIGVDGDRSCERLETVYHCLNCSVYISAGRSLLDRTIPPDYLQERTQAISQPVEAVKHQLDSLETGQLGETLSVIIFRLGSERFALPVSVLQEVTRPMPIHTLPHRSNTIFLGLVNSRGEVLPCVSLSQFLQVDMPIDPTYSRLNLRRAIVVGQQRSQWVFPVDEVYRVHRFDPNVLQEPPVVVAKASQAYTQGVIDWQDGKVNYLDADALLNALDRRLL